MIPPASAARLPSRRIHEGGWESDKRDLFTYDRSVERAINNLS